MSEDIHSDSDCTLYCHCGYAGVAPAAARQGALERLYRPGPGFHAVADLCLLAARKDGLLRQVAGAGRVTVAACHPRAVKWLFASAGASLPEGRTVFLNLRAANAGETLDALPGNSPERVASARLLWRRLEASRKGPWTPWFPVIDNDRCVECGQCASFCLFGVYSADGQGKVTLAKPRRCKNGCPACARMCPRAAIIFPKYKAGPINGGDQVEEINQEKLVHVDASALLKNDPDLYQKLRARSRGPTEGSSRK